MRHRSTQALFALALALVSLLVSHTASHAQSRVALVIGNGAYRHVPPLENPANDAAAIAALFGQLGFSVTKVENAVFNTMRATLDDFVRRARGAEMVAVFFAGHGMELSGENWLIATDAQLKNDTDAAKEAISLKDILQVAESASKLGLVILDACRNNPFGTTTQGTARSADRGFVRVGPQANVLVAYAAKDGTTAADGTGRNSPFTVALVKHLVTPGLDIQFVFRRVRDDVLAATNREQFPYVYGSLSQEGIYLRPPLANVEKPPLPAAGDYPRRTITLVLPFAQGGPSDVVARILAQQLSRALGQQVEVQNQLGENGRLGTRTVARAAPDGYTLLVGDTVTHGINPSLFPTTAYDPHNDFEPVGLFGTTQLALVAHPSVQAKTVGELIALLKREPQRASFSIPGLGTLDHLIAQQFATAAGIKITPVPYPGGAPALKAVFDGQSPLLVTDPRFVAGFVKDGRLRALAVTGTRRSALLPGVPTLAESGLGRFEAVRSYGLLVPAGTPASVIDKLNAALRNALAADDLRAKLAAQGVEVTATTAERHAHTIDREVAKWFRVMRSAGIEPR